MTMELKNQDRLLYEKTFDVTMRDCDMFRRLKPSAVLTLFQDCSEDLTENWGVGLDCMLDSGFIWVVARVSCQVKALPCHGQPVTFRGWAGRSQMGIYPYSYHLLDQEGRELITGSSLWTIADVQTHSMMGSNVPRLTLPSPEGEDSFLPKMRRIPNPASFQTVSRQVRYSETDINGHLTNAKYLDWVCDLAPQEFHRTHPMTGLRIDYRAECRPGEDIALDWALDDTCLWCRSQDRFTAAVFF
ncbi:MAG: thioesterase [Oscillospiraceae bacterium]|nr:thioesterase [Oscillospiraceae bacterium]